MASLFNAHQRATIEAATARIVPADHDPGALEAGVIEFIESTLSSYDQTYRQLYLDGVTEIDQLAQEQFGKLFSSLQPSDQDQVLTILEKRGSRFFSRLVEHTMEGFYGDPRHGGNKDRVGWKLLGFPGPSFPDGYKPPLGWYDAHLPDEFTPPKK